MSDDPVHPSKQKPITDPLLRRAVACIDTGRVGELRRMLADDPSLATRRVEDDHPPFVIYFARPTLLHFVAENPVRTGSLPANITEIVDVLVAAGAEVDAGCGTDGAGTALGLVASGMVPRQSGVQLALVDTLVGHGADPTAALHAAIGHREVAAALRLREHRARLDLPAAAGLGDLDAMASLLPSADDAALASALRLATMNDRREAVARLVEAGVDPSTQFSTGETALHLAAAFGHRELALRLVELGGSLARRDRDHQATPADWADHCGFPALAAELRQLNDADNLPGSG